LKNEKLKPFQRRKLLEKSDVHISNLIDKEVGISGNLDSVDKTIQHLDPSLSDMELMEIWNLIYDKHGCRIPDFREKWEREFLMEECTIPDEVDQNINSLELPDFLKRKKDFVVKNLGW